MLDDPAGYCPSERSRRLGMSPGATGAVRQHPAHKELKSGDEDEFGDDQEMSATYPCLVKCLHHANSQDLGERTSSRTASRRFWQRNTALHIRDYSQQCVAGRMMKMSNLVLSTADLTAFPCKWTSRSLHDGGGFLNQRAQLL